MTFCGCSSSQTVVISDFLWCAECITRSCYDFLFLEALSATPGNGSRGFLIRPLLTVFGRDQKVLYIFCSSARWHLITLRSFHTKNRRVIPSTFPLLVFWSVKKRGMPYSGWCDISIRFALKCQIPKNLPKSELFLFQFMFSKHALPLFIGRLHFYKTFLNLCSCQQCPKHAQWDQRKSLNHSSLTFTGTHTCKTGCERSKFVRECVWSENIANSTLVHQRTSLPWRRVRRIPGRESDHMLQQVTGGGSSQEP